MVNPESASSQEADLLWDYALPPVAFAREFHGLANQTLNPSPVRGEPGLPCSLDAGHAHLCLSSEWAMGPNLRRQGQGFYTARRESGEWALSLPLGPGLTYGARWQRSQSALGLAGDSLTATWEKKTAALGQGLRLQGDGGQVPFPPFVAMAHWTLPTGGKDGPLALGAGGSLEVHFSPKAYGRIGGEWRRHPVTYAAEVPAYQPLKAEAVFVSRQLSGDLGYRGLAQNLAWHGSLWQWEDAPVSEADYAAQGQAWVGSQGGQWQWRSGSGQGPWIWTLAGEGSLGQGHALAYRGDQGDDDSFAWAPWRLYAGRALLRLEHLESPEARQGGWDWGGEARLSSVIARLVRPKSPHGKWLWNRNQILDAYTGGLTGLVSRETWLGTGRAALASSQVSAFAGKTWATGSWQWRPGLQMGLHQVEWHAWAHLARRRTELLLSTAETLDTLATPSHGRWLLRPGFRLGIRKGRWDWRGEVTQVIPMPGGEARSGSGSEVYPGDWRGGLALQAALAWHGMP